MIAACITATAFAIGPALSASPARPGSSARRFGLTGDLGRAASPGTRAATSSGAGGLYPSAADETSREERADVARAQAVDVALVAHRAAVALRAALLAKQHRAAQERAAAARAANARAADARPSPQPTSSPPPVASAPAGPSGSPQQIALAMLSDFGWSSSQFGCLDSLWERESNWNPEADNPYSGAYGIPQALPGSKMASAGADWATDAATQIRWGLGYIQATYRSPCGAWDHETAYGWY